MGIKQIAATVAVIVVIGLIIAAIESRLGGWIDQIWNFFVEQIENLTS